MKKIFIYYSFTGNGDEVANYLKNKNIAIRKVNTKEPLPKNRILSIITGGFLAGINHKDKLIDFDSDVSNYKSIMIGSPIWNGKLSCPINTVLDKIDLTNKEVTFILYSGSGDAPKTNKMLKEKYSECKIIHLKEPKQNQNTLERTLKNI